MHSIAIEIFLKNDRVVVILKKGVHRAYDCDERSLHSMSGVFSSMSEGLKMGMIGQRCPGVASGFYGRWRLSKVIFHVITVFAVPKYLQTFDATDDDVIKQLVPAVGRQVLCGGESPIVSFAKKGRSSFRFA